MGPRITSASASSVPPREKSPTVVSIRTLTRLIPRNQPAMPRPKVKPQDRQRSVRACDACKASKKRCDANQPCRLCLKKGTQDTCTYTPTARDKRSRPSLQQSNTATTATSSYPKRTSVAAENSPTDFRSILTGSTQRSRHHFDDRAFSQQQDEGIQDAEEDADSDTEENPESRNSVETSTQKPVMLSSSSGDKGMAPFLLPILYLIEPCFAVIMRRVPSKLPDNDEANS